MIYAITAIVLIVILKLIYDYDQWLSHKQVDHLKEWLAMAFLSVPSVIIFTMESRLIWYLAALLSGIMCAAFIWVFFNGPYNKLRGYAWTFTGDINEHSAKTDLFLNNFKPWQRMVIELGLLIISITIYIISIK